MHMPPATRLMLKYAAYHRDRRNIATHFIGIPLIVFAIGVLLGHWRYSFGGLSLDAAELLWVGSTIWYMTLQNWTLALAVGAANGVLFALGAPLGLDPHWVLWGMSAFVVGWLFQFVGHYFEGKKPAFVDDLTGLLVGPMFVVGEALFALGWGAALKGDIERAVGPTVSQRGT